MSVETYETIAFTCPRINVYQIPPRLIGKPFRTDSWGHLANPLFVGRLRVVQVHDAANSVDKCEIRIEDSNTGELFASAPYVGEHAAQRSEDSSRYWQLRVVHEKKVTYLGIGFEDTSFDFQVALQDHTKAVKAAKDASNKSLNRIKDYSIKDGESLNIPLKTSNHSDTNTAEVVEDHSVQSFLLPPPPSASKSRRNIPVATPTEDDEFGDFQ